MPSGDRHVTISSNQFGPGSLGERTFKSRSLWWVGPHLPPLLHPIRRRGEKKQVSTNLSLGL